MDGFFSGELIGDYSRWSKGDCFVAGYHEIRMECPEYADWFRGLNESDRAECEAKLLELRAREEKERSESKKRLRRNKVSELSERGVPQKDIARIVDEELADTDAMAAARDFLDGDMTILVLSGPRGCGKTTAAAWLASQFRESDEELSGFLRSFSGASVAIFLDVSQLARVNRYSESEMAKLERVSTLVIDDLGMEFNDQKGSFLATLDGLVNARYANSRVTVITTNVNAKTFKERYGERIADRIRETGRFVELNGKSLRGRR